MFLSVRALLWGQGISRLEDCAKRMICMARKHRNPGNKIFLLLPALTQSYLTISICQICTRSAPKCPMKIEIVCFKMGNPLTERKEQR